MAGHWRVSIFTPAQPNRQPRNPMPTLETLQDLLLNELRDLYSAEQQLVKALPKMAKAASHMGLKQAFTDHLAETEAHVVRLEEAFRLLEVPASARTCKAMQGLIAEGEEAVKLKANDVIRDACLIGAAQRVEHYEIAAYGTARAFAEALGLSDIAALLNSTIHEEGAADKKLTSLSATVNGLAAVAGHAA
jgi:ferritin-like metal-binding protein YciE